MPRRDAVSGGPPGAPRGRQVDICLDPISSFVGLTTLSRRREVHIGTTRCSPSHLSSCLHATYVCYLRLRFNLTLTFRPVELFHCWHRDLVISPSTDHCLCCRHQRVLANPKTVGETIPSDRSCLHAGKSVRRGGRRHQQSGTRTGHEAPATWGRHHSLTEFANRLKYNSSHGCSVLPANMYV